MSKKELERKQREEQEATAHAFQEFIQAFQDGSGPPNKLFVKSGILYARAEADNDHERGQIYNPRPTTVRQDGDTIRKAIECAKLVKETKVERAKGYGKPKSNLELLKEELRLRHLGRGKGRTDTGPSAQVNVSAYESDDKTSTNLFVANINPNTTEQDLMQQFGVYGPLASVKIMWPRGDERSRNNNVGFVAFMSRKDGERAFENLKDRDDMRIGWAKPLEIPAHPVYIPPDLLKLMLPPPQTGLPFNAQPKNQYEDPQTLEDMDRLLARSTVNVTLPLDKKMLAVIHRVVEFVVREGPLFEAMIMNREINNPTYKFLFDNNSPNHVYYRWKLCSILNGEGLHSWSSKEFRMFKGGSVWIPPILPDYTIGMPDYVFKPNGANRKHLSQAQRFRLISHIQNLTTSRLRIGEAMVFCMNHEGAAADVMGTISESFENEATTAWKKIARLYLVSDILYNANAKKSRRAFVDETRRKAASIFRALERTHDSLAGGDRAHFRSRVLKVMRSWETWKVLEPDELRQLEKFVVAKPQDDDSDSDEPLDGKSLIKRSLHQNSLESRDGSAVTILDNAKRNKSAPNPSDFVSSKWESVTPDEIEAQAMSTKKIFDLEMERFRKAEGERKLTERERSCLRQIEVMAMQYQDELESGKRKRRQRRTIGEEVMRYRKRLLEKISTDGQSSDDEAARDRSKKSLRKRRRVR